MKAWRCGGGMVDERRWVLNVVIGRMLRMRCVWWTDVREVVLSWNGRRASAVKGKRSETRGIWLPLRWIYSVSRAVGIEWVTCRIFS